MIKWLRSLFAWREVSNTGVWLYRMNDVTLRREAIKIAYGYQPVDEEWLNANGQKGKIRYQVR